MTKIPTPLTDAAEYEWKETWDPHYDAVSPEFCRRLERALSVAVMEINLGPVGKVWRAYALRRIEAELKDG